MPNGFNKRLSKTLMIPLAVIVRRPGNYVRRVFCAVNFRLVLPLARASAGTACHFTYSANTGCSSCSAEPTRRSPHRIELGGCHAPLARTTTRAAHFSTSSLAPRAIASSGSMTDGANDKRLSRRIRLKFWRSGMKWVFWYMFVGRRNASR
jgi:hypothetical protein